MQDLNLRPPACEAARGSSRVVSLPLTRSHSVGHNLGWSNAIPPTSPLYPNETDCHHRSRGSGTRSGTARSEVKDPLAHHERGDGVHLGLGVPPEEPLKRHDDRPPGWAIARPAHRHQQLAAGGRAAGARSSVAA